MIYKHFDITDIKFWVTPKSVKMVKRLRRNNKIKQRMISIKILNSFTRRNSNK